MDPEAVPGPDGMNEHDHQRHLVIVQSPDCYLFADNAFVICEILLNGWLGRVAAVGPRISLSTTVTGEVANRLADALGRLEQTADTRLADDISGNSEGGMEAFCGFLRGGGFGLVDGETVKPEDIRGR